MVPVVDGGRPVAAETQGQASVRTGAKPGTLARSQVTHRDSVSQRPMLANSNAHPAAIPTVSQGTGNENLQREVVGTPDMAAVAKIFASREVLGASTSWGLVAGRVDLGADAVRPRKW